MTLLFALWLACATSTPTTPDVEAPAPTATAPIELPGDFLGLPLPTEGATVQKHEGQEMVLDYPGKKVRELVTAYVNALNDAGWALEEPKDGGRFIQVEAHKDGKTLEFFVVRQPERTEVHLELL